MKNLTHYFKKNDVSAPEVGALQSNGENDLDDKVEETASKQTLKGKRRKKKKGKVSDESLSSSFNINSSEKAVKGKQKRDEKKGLLKERSLNNSADDFESVNPNESVGQVAQKKRAKSRSEIAESSTATLNEEIIVVEEQTTQANDLEDTQNCVDLKEQPASTPKLNAFEFMMESRTKSIGRNSPGKERNPEIGDENTTVNKEKFSARKSLLQGWADRKGGLKRKRVEEEAEESVKIKLKKRADRLKKMLTTEKANVSKKEVQSERNVFKIKMFSPKKNVSQKTATKTNKRKRKKTRLSLSTNEQEEEELVEVVGKKKVSQQTETKRNKRNGKKTKLDLSISEKKEEEIVEIDGKKTGKKIEITKDESVLQQKDKKRGKKTRLVLSSSEEEGEEIVEVDGKETRQETEVAKDKKNVLQQPETNTNKRNAKKTKLALSTSEEEDEGTVKVDGEETRKEIEITKDKKNISQQTETKTNKRKGKKTRLALSTSEEDEDIIKVDGEECEKETKITKAQTEDNGFNQHSPSKKAWKMKIKVSVDDKIENETSSPLRRSTRTKKPTKRAEEIVLIESESTSEVVCIDEEENVKRSKPKRVVRAEGSGRKEESKKPVKLAPIFLKNLPKPVVDPKEIEAKKNFLYSGIPETLRKAIDKERSVEAKELETFPKISHIQQKTSESSHWQLPSVDFTFRKQDSPVKTPQKFSLTPLPCTKKSEASFQLETISKPLNLKLILKEIKNEYPEFPVYKTFRLLREKSCKSNKQRKEALEEESTVWTEKYKARTSTEILGNNCAIRELKNWLKSWVDLGREVASQRKRNNSSSSEFETSDGDSRDSMGLPSNTVIVSGPVAAGKTMAVYAIANELEINVLELNASSKRTGKRLLQELQEATQSHQVRKNSNLFEMCKLKQSNDENDQTSTKMCLLLVEDVDIVFEQDEGFLYSLNQLLSTSKRPVVLVTSDINSENLMKFSSQYKTIQFNKVGVKILSTWLQLVCLLEGLFIAKNSVEELLQYNKSDVRKTLLQLQFWVNSSGEKHIENTQVLSIDDDDNSSHVEEENPENTTDCSSKKDSCLKGFLFTDNDTLWWNLPELLKISSSDNKKSVRLAAMLLETQSFVDLLDGLLKTDGRCDFYGKTVIKDSLELKEHLQGYNHDENIKRHILDSCFDVYRKTTQTQDVFFNFGLPNTEQRKWFKTQQNCDESFSQILSLGVRTEKKAMALDYLSTLRDISRLEMSRQAVNNKRGNRFYNYLQGLGVDCSESVLKTACEMFM